MQQSQDRYSVRLDSVGNHKGRAAYRQSASDLYMSGRLCVDDRSSGALRSPAYLSSVAQRRRHREAISRCGMRFTLGSSASRMPRPTSARNQASCSRASLCCLMKSRMNRLLRSRSSASSSSVKMASFAINRNRSFPKTNGTSTVSTNRTSRGLSPSRASGRCAAGRGPHGSS
jgi:hypothetical protein